MERLGTFRCRLLATTVISCKSCNGLYETDIWRVVVVAAAAAAVVVVIVVVVIFIAFLFIVIDAVLLLA